MADERASVKRRRRIPAIWIVPLVTALLGLWMVYYTWQNQGPEITIVFSTAEGIESGKTKIRSLSVQVGLVTDLRLGEDNESVIVTAELDEEHGLLQVARVRAGESYLRQRVRPSHADLGVCRRNVLARDRSLDTFAECVAHGAIHAEAHGIRR